MEIKDKKESQEYINIIIKYSQDKDYNKAILEWRFVAFYPNEKGNCICEKPINNLYIIENIINKKRLINGCDCIDKVNNPELHIQIKSFQKFNKKINDINDPKKKTNFEKKIEKIFNEYYFVMYDYFNSEKNLIEKEIIKEKQRIFKSHYDILDNIESLYNVYYKFIKSIYYKDTKKNEIIIDKLKITKVKFGKYKGKNYFDMDINYIKWFDKQDKKGYNDYYFEQLKKIKLF